MLDERHKLQTDGKGTATPSKYWSDFCSTFDYMLGLSEEYFSKLRLHTYHLTGDNYQKYFFEKGKDALLAEWTTLIKNLPAEYVVTEPEAGIGFEFADGTILSKDVVRYQQVISTLFHHGIFSSLINTSGTSPLLLEIGAGYGALAHHLVRIIKKCTYIIVDLPETLIFSAPYLALLNPDKKLYLYDKNNYAQMLQPDTIHNFDFILLPNYKLDALSAVRFDLVVNMASFQEMKKEQVADYLNFVAKTCKGTLYSWNQNVKPKNKELLNLTEMLKERFECEKISPTAHTEKFAESVRYQLKKIAAAIGLIDKTRVSSPDWHYYEYICKPKPY